MGEADLEVELKVWKELAVAKQILIATATDALGLDPDCPPEELRAALDKAIKRSIEADVRVKDAQDQARTAVAVMEKKASDSEKARNKAEAELNEIRETQKDSDQNMAGERALHAKEMQKIKTDLAARQDELKAINVALADTPQNVVKKLKKLKKEKLDESAARQQAEALSRTLRKEKQELDKELKQAQADLKEAGKLAKGFRDLHKQCGDQYYQLKELVEDASSLAEVTALDEGLLERIEKAAGIEEEKEEEAKQA